MAAVLLAVVAVLGLAELTARALKTDGGYPNPYYVKISEGFQDLDALVADNRQTFRQRYYDEFVYSAAPVRTSHTNFTDYYSARLTPDSVPLDAAAHIVWAFGGSTMMNLETTDALTIANTWARMFNAGLGPTHVKNFGSGSFLSSHELVKFQKLLREVPPEERPTIAVFYDGYNDAEHAYRFGAGHMQRDLALKLRALVEREHAVLGAYQWSELLGSVSQLWKSLGENRLEQRLFPRTRRHPEAENLDDAVRIYTSNTRMIDAICRSFDIECYFVLQPLVVTKDPLTEVEQEVLGRLGIGPEGVRFVRSFYARVRERMAGRARFIDASRLLNGRTQPDFYDLGHTAAQTAPVLGRLLGERILLRREMLLAFNSG